MAEQDLNTRIAEAEQAGDWDTVDRLNAQKLSASRDAMNGVTDRHWAEVRAGADDPSGEQPPASS